MRAFLCIILLLVFWQPGSLPLQMNILHANNIFVVNSNSRTLSKVDLANLSVNNSFTQIGLFGNHIAYHEARACYAGDIRLCCQLEQPVYSAYLANKAGTVYHADHGQPSAR